MGLSFKEIVEILNSVQNDYIKSHGAKKSIIAVLVIRKIKSKILNKIKEKYGSQTEK